MLRIAWIGASTDTILDSLTALGQPSVQIDLLALTAGQFDVAFWDCRPESSITSPLSTYYGLDIPLIAVVGPTQSDETFNALGPVDDCVTALELDSQVFRWRLRQLLQRYRQPMSLANLSQPEMSFFQRVADNASEWLIVKDLDHRFLLVSDSFTDITGLPQHKIIGKNDLEIGSDEESVFGNPQIGWPGFWPQDDAAIALGKPTHEDNPDWRVFSPTARYKKTWRVPLKNAQGDVYALLISSVDVTDEIRTEHELRDSEVMLKQVTAEKRRAEESHRLAEQAVGAKNRFLAAASHDLRQPLHAMGLFLELLDRRVVTPSEIDLVDKLKHSCASLTALFDSLLDISRLDAGTIDVSRQHMEVEEVLNPLRDEFRVLAEVKRLGVHIEACHEVVNTDPVLLARILRNLLQNAFTHTEQGHIAVRSSISEHGLRVVVSDTGPGIPAPEQERIFEEFYQLEKDSPQGQQGMGLGLAIVRRLARLLSIDIQMDSMVGRGTVFTLMVPLGECESLPAPPLLQRVPDISGICVLVVDDDAGIRQGMKYMFEAYDCSALTATSGDDAQQVIDAASVSPDIVIVDYQLPGGLTGDVIVRKLRQSLQREIPAIIITGDTSAERLRDAAATGSPLLHKPVQPDDLIRAVADQLAEQTTITG